MVIRFTYSQLYYIFPLTYVIVLTYNCVIQTTNATDNSSILTDIKIEKVHLVLGQQDMGSYSEDIFKGGILKLRSSFEGHHVI